VELVYLAAAAAQSIAPPPAATVEEAIERQRGAVLDAISPCRRSATREEIVVCGRRHADMPDLARTASGASPPESWAAPANGPWFEFRRGPLSLTCCSVDGGRGSGAGLGLRLRF
jgi:hypothetical protein